VLDGINLPKEISESDYLTGNEIAKLSNISELPSQVLKSKVSRSPDVYKNVRKLLKKNLIFEAWDLLYA
jgi:hypothetical protein